MSDNSRTTEDGPGESTVEPPDRDPGFGTLARSTLDVGVKEPVDQVGFLELRGASTPSEDLICAQVKSSRREKARQKLQQNVTNVIGSTGRSR